MEATFYEDSRYRGSSREGVVVGRAMKRPMTLDLDSSKYSKKQKVNTLLTSPDLNMLKLASPELERLIIAQHGPISSTPTLSQSQCMYPAKTATTNTADDRIFHSRDFPDALEVLQQHPTTTSSSMYHPLPDISTMPPACTSMESTSYYQQPSTNCSNSMIPSTSAGVMSSATATCYPAPNYYMPTTNLSVKEEPQTVPCIGVTPPLSPIDMENQEKIKLERKRLRNRIAASKCRRRKLEKIARLEDKVSALKDENSELSHVVNTLREQVCSLKQQVLDHVRCGCEFSSIRPDIAQF